MSAGWSAGWRHSWRAGSLGGDDLKFDTLQFVLFCFCWRLVENAEADKGRGQLDISEYRALLEDYLEALLPSHGGPSRGLMGAASTLLGYSSSTTASNLGADGRNSLSTGTGSGRGIGTAVRDGPEHGLVFTYLMAELWLHRYVPVEFPHLPAPALNHQRLTPSKAVLECVLATVKHVCRVPYPRSSSSTSSFGGTGGQLSARELKPELRVLQRPVFQLVLHCFKYAVDQQELELVIRIWVEWMTMSASLIQSRTGMSGLLSPKKREARKLKPEEELWVIDNFVFFYILPPHWLQSMHDLAKKGDLAKPGGVKVRRPVEHESIASAPNCGLLWPLHHVLACSCPCPSPPMSIYV